MQEKIRKKSGIIIALILLAFILITLLTRYYGSTDTPDYSDTAKYFAGKLASDIRNSHSFLYGFMNAPFVKLMNNFFIFKIMSLIFLLLIIYSVYRISGKNKKALWLILVSPIIWYMAPWINPIQIASLLFLWAYYSIREYDKSGKLRYLACSGILVGLSWAFWDTVLFFGFFLMIAFLYNKKFYHFVYAAVFVLIGLSPRLILDTFLFNFPFYSMMKSSFGTFANIFGGIYGKAILQQATSYSSGIFVIIPVILSIPVFFWALYSKSLFKKEKNTMIFLTLSLLLIAANPQARYSLILIPIMTLLLAENISDKNFRIQMAISAVITLLFIAPYVIQIGYSMTDNYVGADFSTLVESNFNINLSHSFKADILQADLQQISKDYPNQTFLVGNLPDEFQMLAHFYWGSDITKFVSIQDYNLWINNQTILYEKTFMPTPKINDRRQIWISGGISKNINDRTDYNDIIYGIGVGEPIDIQNFKVIKKYSILYISGKEE